MPTPLPIGAVNAAAMEERLQGPDSVNRVAQEFESLLLSQLMETMRRTVPEGMLDSGMGSEMFQTMLDQSLASSMAEAGGIGLARLLASQLGGGEEESTTRSSDGPSSLAIRRARAAYNAGGVSSAAQGPSRPAVGALAQVRQAAAEMVTPGPNGVWGREGRLAPTDLTNDFVTETEAGPEVFNVLDAEGFEGYYKCNLFAFELAFRSGLSVPVQGRGRGWGYPGPNGVVNQIETGRLDPRWASVATDTDPKGLEEAIGQGRVFMLVGEGRPDRSGHMGVVDEVHDVVRDDEGRIRRIEYSGWEANGDGAHYRRRTWGTGRFQSIHVLEIQRPEAGGAQQVPLGSGPARPSRLDAARAGSNAAQGAQNRSAPEVPSA